MIEEFAFVLCHLHKDDHDGSLVLGHELLLLAHSQCCRKRGGARGSRHAGPTPLDRLPMCTFKTLEHAVRAVDTIQLERLAWAVFDNIMGLGEAPPLSGLETYSQIVGHLAGKAYKGLHAHCPVRTSTSFGAEVTTGKTERPRPKETCKVPVLFHDARREERVRGVILHPQGKTRQYGKRPIIGTNAYSGPKHPGNEMDEGTPMFL